MNPPPDAPLLPPNLPPLPPVPDGYDRWDYKGTQHPPRKTGMFGVLMWVGNRDDHREWEVTMGIVSTYRTHVVEAVKDSPAVPRQAPVTDSLRETPRTLADQLREIAKDTGILAGPCLHRSEKEALDKAADRIEALERELAEASKRKINLELSELYTVASAHGFQNPLVMMDAWIAAKQDSERLEWLIQRIVQSAGHPAWTRENIDDAMREGDGA